MATDKTPSPSRASFPTSHIKRAASTPTVILRSTERGKRRGVAAFGGDATQVIRAMRIGAPADIVSSVADRLGISQDKLFERLRLPKSTLKGRVSKGQPLAAVEQDRIYRVNRVFERANAVLEDEEAARNWIIRENRSLGGESPLSLLDTEAGYELVLDTLGRIEHGVIS
jgi:putative toxin-antitoxin system antitoxin component (TIGR02293 family)